MRRPLQNQTFYRQYKGRLKNVTMTILGMILWVNLSLGQTTFRQSECHCLGSTVVPADGQFRDSIVITGLPNRTWKVYNADGFYFRNSDPLVEVFDGYIVPEVPVGSGRYILVGKRLSGQGWSLLVSNGVINQFLDSDRACAHPTVAERTITGDSEVCANGAEQYRIPANPNLSNVQWTVTGVGNSIVSASTGNTINVSWGTTPGVYKVEVKGLLRSYVGQQDPCEFVATKLVTITDISKATKIVGDFGNCVGSKEKYRLAAKSFLRPSPTNHCGNANRVCWSVWTDAAGTIPASGVVVADNAGDPSIKEITWPTVGTFYIYVEGEYRATETSPNWCKFTSIEKVEITSSALEPSGNLACAGVVNLSLNPSCELTFFPSQFLTSQPFPNSSYDIVIRDIEADTIVPNGTVGLKYINKRLEVQVIHECSGNSCWGYTTIEDKSVPDLDCPDDVVVECQDIDNIDVTGFPVMPLGVVITPIAGRANHWIVKNYDKCSDLTLSYTDVSVVSCTDPLYSAIITRTWKIVDATGNVSTCVQTISVEKANIEDIEYPGNWDSGTGPNKNIEACSGYPVIPFDENDPNSPNAGHPHPSYTGSPKGVLCLKATVTFRDAVIPINSTDFPNCGDVSYKIVRKWKIVDHCTGRIVDTNQLITIMDTRPPVVRCNQKPDTISTEQHFCGGNYKVPTPAVLDSCGRTTWKVDFLKPGTTDQYVSEYYDAVTRTTTSVVTVGQVRIINLPAGLNEIRYTVTDQCGNFSYCYSPVFVQDQIKPTPVCDRNTVVAIGSSGVGVAGVETVDGGSHDNCMVDFLKIRAMGTTIPTWESLVKNNTITFTCAQVGTTVMVELGVWDKAGNFNNCMAEVKVQDNLFPTIEILPNRTVSCTTNVTSLAQFGTPTFNDNCTANLVELPAVRTLSGCGIGTIDRTFVVTDKDGNSASSTQRITITNANLFTVDDIDWPDTYSPPNSPICFPNVEPDRLPTVNAYPRFLRDTVCSQLVMSYEDVVFKFQDNACFKILRTWTVIDWCQTSIANPNAGVYKNTQLIMITNTDAPTISKGCALSDFVITQGTDCGANVKVRAVANDDCTDSLDLVWNYKIETGPAVINGQGNLIDRNLPAGIHKVTWTVTDGCRNSATCSTTVRITDTKKPTPVCREELVTVIMPTTKSVNIWASDFLKEGIDNCSPKDKVVASFSGTSRAAISRTYTCDSLAGEPFKEFSIKVYAIDEANNSDFCTVTLRVQANDNSCETVVQTVALAGNIYNELSEEVKDVSISLMSDQAEFPKSAMTADDGKFNFEGLTMSQNYEVTPTKNDNPLNGVSTLDLVLIQRHILGLAKLDSPLKLIAADVNSSETITASDLVELRKLILGINTEFSKNQSWRFVDNAIEFADKNNPWPLTERIAMETLDHDVAGLDFHAIKIGDVNLSAKVNANSSNITNRTTASMTTDPNSAKAGETFVTNINVEELQDMVGLQMGLSFDPKQVELIDVTSPNIDLKAENLGYNYINEGKIFISWSTIEKLQAKGAIISMSFKAIKDIKDESVIRVEDATMQPEVYTLNANGTVQTALIGLQVSKTFDKEQFELFQNIPNPFNSTTQIGFTLPNADDVMFTVFDINGKQLYKSSGKYQKGYNTISLDINNLVANGVMYYQLETKSHSATRKMIVIK
jgi:hypothetical protein